MSPSTKRPFSREQRLTIVHGMLIFVLIIVVLQLWLLTATMNAWLGGDEASRGRQCRVPRAERRLVSIPRTPGADQKRRRVVDALLHFPHVSVVGHMARFVMRPN